MKTSRQPPRSVCFARDKYYLHKEVRDGAFAHNQAGAENKFKREIMGLIIKHRGAIEDTTITQPAEDGKGKTIRHTIIRFADGSVARMPSSREVYAEPTPFKYLARQGEQIPEEWFFEDYDTPVFSSSKSADSIPVITSSE